MSTETRPNYSKLLEGYKNVDAFLADEEYEEDEEIVYVTLDLGSGVDSALIPSSKNYRLIGLDTPTPFLQLSGSIFRGRHDELLGTELLFTEDEAGEWSKRTMAHVGSTERRIVFKEVQLKEKKATSQPRPGQGTFTVAMSQELRPDIDLDRLTGKTGPVKKGGKQKERERQHEGAETDGEMDEDPMELDSESETIPDLYKVASTVKTS
ncbi:TFIIIC-sub6 domain-containing protein [Mycena indigotica]|uniref:TFIIIC-sub6 domain-containing protein n=1 Tax=Mycena indigotica TaxID=2126181 RepID=A0A8H6S165_9AGAR|nr:TFIIIC-sub6 domain-containing protein [Mycena indigotica]KAF7290542.1 TFIIIC-sub6 domain-containing protein [Mycena indigotica]